MKTTVVSRKVISLALRCLRCRYRDVTTGGYLCEHCCGQMRLQKMRMKERWGKR